MNAMDKALHEGEQQSPLKATVESVLPGVHQQFVNLHHEVKRVQESLKEIKELRGGCSIDGL